MKKLLCIMMLFALFSCKEKETDLIQVTFWTTEVEGWVLYIDDEMYGKVKQPYYIGNINDIPQCGDSRFSSKMLAAGGHEYYIKITVGGDTFTSETHYFDVSGCTVIRITQ